LHMGESGSSVYEGFPVEYGENTIVLLRITSVN
jgi:hypothetical protein